MNKLLMFISVFILFSCNKYECVRDEAPEMIGDWVHRSENDGFHYLYIQHNGRGSMYGVNNHGNNQDTQRRGWYIKDDILYFSRFGNKSSEDKFVINQYPSEATEVIVYDYDSIEVGDRYMVLNDRIYKKE